PVTKFDVEEIVDKIEADIRADVKGEVSSKTIGELVMEHLKEKDKVAYVRFASVYKEFKDIDTFYAELEKIKGKD
ncbi:MAG: ATP cone domain-containing protein, partial [Oscillospiraceae bacterium]